jgi:hypothetical protein
MNEFRFELENGDEIVFTRRQGMRYALSGFLTFTTLPELPSDSVAVTAFGAVGDGVTDDSAAIQAALDSGKPNVVFPPGKVYLVRGKGNGTNAVPDSPCRVRSNTTLWMDGATVKLAPNQAAFTCVFHLFNVKDVTFKGGKIDGNKATHTVSGNQHQNGGLHGIMIDGGQRLSFYDLELVDCYVDGMLIHNGATDVTIERMKALRNRRQGISITKMTGLVCRHL